MRLGTYVKTCVAVTVAVGGGGGSGDAMVNSVGVTKVDKTPWSDALMTPHSLPARNLLVVHWPPLPVMHHHDGRRSAVRVGTEELCPIRVQSFVSLSVQDLKMPSLVLLGVRTAVSGDELRCFSVFAMVLRVIEMALAVPLLVLVSSVSRRANDAVVCNRHGRTYSSHAIAIMLTFLILALISAVLQFVNDALM
jgi:hypothetical protein